MSPRSVRSYVLASTAVAALWAVAGCGDEDDAAPVPQPSAQQQAPQSPGGATAPPPQRQPAPQASGGSSAAPQGEPSQSPGQPNAPDQAAPPPADTAQAPPRQPEQRPAPAAQRPPAGTVAPSNDPQAQARELIDQIRTHASSMQWKEADAAHAKLKTLRAKVPEELRVEIDNIESYLKAQKAINNVRD